MKKFLSISLCLAFALIMTLSLLSMPAKLCFADESIADIENGQIVSSETVADGESAPDVAEIVESDDTKMSVEEDDSSKPIPPILEPGEKKIASADDVQIPNVKEKFLGRKKIVVFGAGKIEAKPDAAYVTIGVDCLGEDSAAANAQANEIMQKVTAYLKDNGVEDKNMNTKFFSIYERYKYENGESLLGYQVSSLLEVKFTDLENLSSHIENLTNLGANRIGGIDFVCENCTEYYQEALKLALADAKEKANALTDEDFSVCCILEDQFHEHCCRANPTTYEADGTILGNTLEIIAKIKVIFA